MSGKMSAAWWRGYRQRRRLAGNTVRRRAGYVRPPRGDRSAEYALRRSLGVPTVPLLLPHLQQGRRLAFWEDELRLDLHQEAELAVLEGRDPAAAVAAYRAREISWLAHTAPLFSEAIAA